MWIEWIEKIENIEKNKPNSKGLWSKLTLLMLSNQALLWESIHLTQNLQCASKKRNEEKKIRSSLKMMCQYMKNNQSVFSFLQLANARSL